MQYGKSQEAIDRLTTEQRRVTHEAGTEHPFTVTSPTVERAVNSARCLAICRRGSCATIWSRP
jgi:peptide methionine sulfoxide reductase MsrB